ERVLCARATHFPVYAVLVDPPLAGDDARAAAQTLVEADGVEDVRRARFELGVEARPQPARQPARSARHLHAARVARELRGVGVEALGETADHVGVGALLRAVDLRAALPRRVDVAEHGHAHLADAAALGDRLQLPAPAVRSRRHA